MSGRTVPPDWPNAAFSRIVACAPHRWHVQEMGEGPAILLLHGAGASTHSFRGLATALSGYRLIALDLPGQGFTRMGSRMRCGMAPMAEDIAALIGQEGWAPAAIIGHSAGAALGLWLARSLPLRGLVALNGAFAPFRGVAGWLFPMLARFLALNPLSALAFARTATPANVRGLIRSTGSAIDAEGMGFYARLMRDRAHVDATLAMMSQWDIQPLIEAMPGIGVPSLLLAGEMDRAVPPATSARAAERLSEAQSETLPGLGHLMHEERPDLVADRISAFLGPLLKG